LDDPVLDAAMFHQPTSEALRGYAGGSPPSATNRNFSEFFISPSVTITAFPFTPDQQRDAVRPRY
jgi:hypothetical protein